MKATRIWYRAIVSKATPKGLKYEGYPFYEDFPEGTTWNEAMPTISQKTHRISAKAERSALFAGTVQMAIIRPSHFEFSTATTIDKPDQTK